MAGGYRYPADPNTNPLSCTCEGQWTRVAEAFFFHGLLQHTASKKASQRYKYTARPRSLTTVLTAFKENSENMEPFRRRGIHYRLRNVKTGETIPGEALQE